MSAAIAGNKWFLVSSKKALGVVILIHGLNQNPASWKDMIPALKRWGYHVYLLCLKGHRGLTVDGIFKVNAEVWLQNFIDGYRDAASTFPLLPRMLVAYSLGGLVSTVAQGKLATTLFDRQVLLAPAIVTKPYTRLALLLSKFLPQIPSGSPEYYRANKNGVSAAGYRALFDLENKLRHEQPNAYPKCPTRIVMRKDDELISYKGIKKLIEKKKLKSYKILTVPTDMKEKYIPPYKHLVIDQQGLGEKGWQWLLGEMKTFFTRDNNV